MAEGGESPPAHKKNPWLKKNIAAPAAVNRQVSEEDVANQSRPIIEHLIHDQLVAEHLDAPSIQQLHDENSPSGPPIDPEVQKNIAQYLRTIGDQIDKDADLQRMTEKLDIKNKNCKAMFYSICAEIFQDGTFNWGRVAAVFHLAYTLVRRALSRIPLIRSIIDWTVDIIRRYAAPWIASRGGWSSVVEYFGSTDWQVFGALSIFGLALLYVFWKGSHDS